MMLNGQAPFAGPPCAPEELLRVSVLEWKAKVINTLLGRISDNHLKKFNNDRKGS